MERSNSSDHILNINDDIVVKRNFKLENAVCNHGFFMMAPNQWCHSTKILQRPLRLVSSPFISINSSISQSTIDNSITITLHDPPTSRLSCADDQAIMDQVRRMLRISEKEENAMKEFHAIHPRANEKKFGRLFRSPSLFKDAVKSILLCNMEWPTTLDMVAALCEFQSQVCATQGHYSKSDTSNHYSTRAGNKKRQKVTVVGGDKALVQQDEENDTVSNFPSSYEIANLMTERELEERCKLGYRARFIFKLARDVESGAVKLEELEGLASNNIVSEKLLRIKGIGPFPCATLLMCIGFYHEVPVDTETTKLVYQMGGLEKEKANCKDGNEHIRESYDKYAPFQCLAYWFDLLCFYEGKHGKLSELPNSSYGKVTSIKEKKTNGKVTAIKKIGNFLLEKEVRYSQSANASILLCFEFLLLLLFSQFL